MASLTVTNIEALKATKKFVKTTDQLIDTDPGYKFASKTERRDKARDIERQIQEIWKKEGTFTANAPIERKEGQGKFMYVHYLTCLYITNVSWNTLFFYFFF